VTVPWVSRFQLPPASGDNLWIRYKTAPSPPYSFKALVAISHPAEQDTNFGHAGIGWYDGSSKIETIHFLYKNRWRLGVARWNSINSYNSADYGPLSNSIGGWLRIRDDGTNVYFDYSMSGDDNDFITLYSVAKASGWLGSSGYSNIIFFTNRNGTSINTPTIGTLLSWSQGG
jgi:hypothetical protein